MPQVVTTPARVSRRTVLTVWWGYLVAVLVSGAAIAVINRPRGDTAPVVVAIVLGVACAAAVVSFHLTRGLPAAGHPVFDAVGNRFDAAIRNLFVRFVLAGAAAEVAGVLGGVLHLFGAPLVLSGGMLSVGIVLLVRLRRRIAPLVHYLA